jgi:UDP-N-acetylglucosamine acyltransferase
MHKLLYRQGLTLDDAQAAIAALKGQGGDADVQLMLDFLAGPDAASCAEPMRAP